MKLDILKKLIALANNNPNDNEANFAARKACKALVEHKYIEQLTDIVKVPNNPPPRPTPPKSPPNTGDYNPFAGSYYKTGYDPFEEFFGKKGKWKEPPPGYQKYEGDKDKGFDISSELRERKTSWQYESAIVNPITDSIKYWNPLTKKYYTIMFQDKWYEETGQRHSSDTKEFRAGANYGQYTKEPKDKSYNKTGNPADEKYYKRKKDRGFGDDVRKLKCKTCGQVKNTRFVGLAEIFECNECQWEAYTKEKPKESKAANRTCTSCRTPISCIASNYCHKQGVSI